MVIQISEAVAARQFLRLFCTYAFGDVACHGQHARHLAISVRVHTGIVEHLRQLPDTCFMVSG